MGIVLTVPPLHSVLTTRNAMLDIRLRDELVMSSDFLSRVCVLSAVSGPLPIQLDHAIIKPSYLAAVLWGALTRETKYSIIDEKQLSMIANDAITLINNVVLVLGARDVTVEPDSALARLQTVACSVIERRDLDSPWHLEACKDSYESWLGIYQAHATLMCAAITQRGDRVRDCISNKWTSMCALAALNTLATVSDTREQVHRLAQISRKRTTFISFSDRCERTIVRCADTAENCFIEEFR